MPNAQRASWRRPGLVPDGLSRRIAALAVVLVTVLAAVFPIREARAQQSSFADAGIRMLINSEFRTPGGETDDGTILTSNEHTFGQYIGKSRAVIIARLVTGHMKDTIEHRLQDYALIEDIAADSFPVYQAAGNCYTISNSIWIDEFATLTIAATIRHCDSALGIVQHLSRRLLAGQALSHYPDLSGLADTTMQDTIVLNNLAANLVATITPEITQWAVKTSIKLRVLVMEPTQSQSDTLWAHLAQDLQFMVEGELAHSEAIMVLKPSDAASTFVNYKIHSSFFRIGDTMRVDLECIKEPSGRIVAGSKAIVNRISISELSQEITKACSRLKRSMLSDFYHSAKTIAIVAEPPIRYFSRSRGPRELQHITCLLTRNLTAKFRHVMGHVDSVCESGGLEIYDNTEMIDAYTESYAPPADIIHDLDVDYLAVVKIEDMGAKIQISTVLHSYEHNLQSCDQSVYQNDAAVDSKADIEDVLRKTAETLAGKFCGIAVPSSCEVCSPSLSDSTGRRQSSLAEHSRRAPICDLRKKKTCGVRVGIVVHDKPNLFLGREASTYWELYITHLLPNWRTPGFLGLPTAGLPGWLSNELEITIGMQFGQGSLIEKFKRHGVFAGFGFLNYKLVYSALQYSEFPITLNAGGGIGGAGINFRYDPGEQQYTGDFPFSEGTFCFATDLFVGIDMSLIGPVQFQGILRRILTDKQILTFSGLPLDQSVKDDPVGTLGGWYLSTGLKYSWR